MTLSDTSEIITTRRGVRILELQHYWQERAPGPLQGGSYTDELIVRNRYMTAARVPYYDDRGLRTKVDWMIPNQSNEWIPARQETYSYDVLGQLTATNYDDTGPNGSWSYDPAGNRSNTWYSYNNLNMMLTSPGAYYENDILGNRLWRNWGSSTTVQRYLWDDVGRLQSVCGASDGARYKYRADGMRVLKVADLTVAWVGEEDAEEASGYYDEILSTNKPTTRYYYDGQMCMEQDDTTITPGGGDTVETTRYGIGARGIDFIGTWRGQDLNVIVFPIYDGHGNQIAQIQRSTNDTYLLGNVRTYDVWGLVRSGNTAGPPNQRYCANLGHVQDDESDLIYMRARYYEPWTGRFVSEDPATDGANWFVYCSNSPIGRGDYSGKAWHILIGFLLGAGIDAGIQYLLYGEIDWGRVAVSGVAGAAGAFTGGLFAAKVGLQGGWASALLGKSRLDLGKRLGKQVIGAATRAGVKGVAGALNSQDERELNGPLGKVLAAHYGNSILIDLIVNFLEDGVNGI